MNNCVLAKQSQIVLCNLDFCQEKCIFDKIEQKRRGWVDEADKKRKILQLPALHYATKLHGRIGVSKAYDAGNICSVVLSHQLSGCSLYRYCIRINLTRHSRVQYGENVETREQGSSIKQK